MNFHDEFLDKVTEYPNRYHVAEKGTALGASVAEIKIIFGIFIATLITQLTNKCYRLLVGVLLDTASQINLEEWD